MEKVYGIIYKTTCLVNGKIYIGQTTRLSKKYYIGSGSYLKKAIKKYGKENFIRETLMECYNQTELDEWEDLLIWEYNSRDKSIGYNIAKGSVLGAIGENNPCKLPEVRAKLSGKKKSEETRKKMRVANTGKTHSEETKAKIGVAKKGKTLSEETKKKMGVVGSIPVCQYDKQGYFIYEYYGAREACRQTGIFSTSITRCCKGKKKSAGGYIWKYKL